jgi:hypothetical protein
MVIRLGGAPAGLSHFVGEPVSAGLIGNLTAGLVKQLEQTELGNLLDMPNDETDAGRQRRVSCIGARPQPSSTSRFTSGSNGMGVVMCDDEFRSTA